MTVINAGFSPRPDDPDRWGPTFKGHRETCRYAKTAFPLAGYLDLWGHADYAVMVREGRVTACKVCKPDLLEGVQT